MNSLSPSSILITGATGGIGAALAEIYARTSVTMFLGGRNEGRLGQVAEHCRKRGATVHTQTLDVTDATAMLQWVRSSDKDRPLDLLIANAGISSSIHRGPMVDSDTVARDIFATNVTGVLNTTEPVIPLMQTRKRGQIAVMSSLAGLRTISSAPAYSASKVAVREYGEALRPKLAGDGIGVSVIMPAFVESGITAQNPFPMPMIMPAKRAAEIIKRGLVRNKRRIAFPFPAYAMMWALAALPPVIADALLARCPRKA